jgi:hypothetical protein
VGISNYREFGWVLIEILYEGIEKWHWQVVSKIRNVKINK